jgi:hypothetical protein
MLKNFTMSLTGVEMLAGAHSVRMTPIAPKKTIRPILKRFSATSAASALSITMMRTFVNRLILNPICLKERDMTKTAFNRDGILDSNERLTSARKCLGLLVPLTDGMGEKEAAFIEDMENKIDHFGVSERQLAWLRDLVSKYAA